MTADCLSTDGLSPGSLTLGSVDAAQLRVALIQDERTIDSFAWNALADAVVFRQHEWLAAWWNHFRRSNDELFLLTVYDERRELIGLAPWYLARERWLGRVVRFLGSGRVCSEYLTVLAAPGTAPHVVRSLAQWLTGEGAACWDLLDFDGVAQDDGLLGQLADELSLAGHSTYRRVRERTWRLCLPASWDDLLAGLSKSRRGKIRAQERKFLASGRAQVKSAVDETTRRQGLEVLYRLHQARRESLGDDGCFTMPRFERFLEDAAARLDRSGQLRLQWLEVDGQPAAVEFDLLGGDTLYYYQTGMNPELAEISPGWLLQIASLKRAISDGLAHFDFLRGDEEYKATWGAEPRPLAQVRVASRRPLARLRQQLWIAALEGKTRWQNRCGKKDC
ncbi:MAG TPA: GNAT family N-acetyltransferase [Pirellulales bacterium]|nr:GNAT family N-acetyltransferase [Pirellulales bacterium]